VEVLAPLIAGLLLVLLVPRLREATEAVLLAGMLLVGALLWSALVQVGGSQIYFLWYPYAAAGALAAAAIVALVEDRGELRRRALRIAAPAAAALLLLAVISPRPFTGVAEPRAEFSGWRNLTFTKGIYEGLVWVRENTPEEAVIAVNNGHSQPKVARNCAYTAFSERRAMLECEYGAMANGAYPPLAALRSRRATHPYERRFLLNERIFRRGDPDAIRAAHERYGVDYLVLDRRFAYHPGSIAALDRAARRVYEGPQVIVYAVELEGETDGAGR
jgi:hypothetical protein